MAAVVHDEDLAGTKQMVVLDPLWYPFGIVADACDDAEGMLGRRIIPTVVQAFFQRIGPPDVVHPDELGTRKG